MPTSDFHSYVIEDLLIDIPGITSRAMFGGWGIYKDGVIFGLIADDQLYFKVDDQNKPQYEEHGSSPFVYEQGGHPKTTMSYWLVPADILEDKNALSKWVEEACQASIRSKTQKKKSKKS